MNKKDILNYWLKSSDNDYKTMLNLIKSKDYHWALFMGHLVIEKLLKAYYIKNIGSNIPFIHDLLRIAEKANLSLSDIQKDILDLITTFNIKARYDDYKLEFYNKCTKKFTDESIKKIKEMRKWLTAQLKK